MKNFLISLLVLIGTVSCTNADKNARTTADFNFNWKFHLGDMPEAAKAGFNSSDWQDVRLPHDWSVEHSFTQEKTDGATGFLPGGIGWYHKTFQMPANAKNKVTWIEFDGVYTNSEVWVNGHYLGKRPFGYAPFSYQLTSVLNYGGANEIAVRVGRSAYADSRWYPGSGIYRNVKLVTTSKTHIPQWGLFVTTPKVDSNSAEVAIATELNLAEDIKTIMLRISLYDEEGEVAQKSVPVSNDKGKAQIVKTSIEIDEPDLWSTDNPVLYKANAEVLVNGLVVDEQSTNFGIRSFKFDAKKGFFLNGKNMLLKGVCLHHDGGLVGAAVPRGVWERRLKILKDAGCNAIRTAHNPPSEEFLDICDEMGFLVQDEAFDEFQNPKDKRKNYNQSSVDDVTRGYSEHFNEWAEQDLKNMLKRDRNHPSIIMWSIGNEIEWTFPQYGAATGYWGSNKVGDVNYYWDEPPFTPEQIKKNFEAFKQEDICVKTARQLSAWVKEMDTTRPVTANLVIPSVSMFSGYADALDIVGLSYRQSVYDYCRKHYPEKVILGTENWTRYHEWQPVVENDYMSGIFMWTGINYMGESRSWPRRGVTSGLLDFAGFKRASYHFFNTLWNDEPQVYITTQIAKESPYQWNDKSQLLTEKEKEWARHQKWGWHNVNTHWNYEAGDSIMVEVYTNQPALELFLNEQSLGIKKLEDVKDHILKWMVPFAKGELKAVAVNNSVFNKINSATEAYTINITADKQELKSNSYDVAHFTVQLVDEAGTPVKHLEKEVVFEIEGPARLLGVDNGAVTSLQDYQSNKVLTSQGRCLMILQSMDKSADIKVTAKAEGINDKTVIIKVN